MFGPSPDDSWRHAHSDIQKFILPTARYVAYFQEHV